MFSISLLVVMLCGILQQSWSRYASLSLNLSLSSSSERLRLTSEVLSSCMKETKLSMSELNRFHMSLPHSEPDAVNSSADRIKDGNMNGNNDDSALLSERNDEALECFAHCLYEQLGLVRNGIYMEHDLFTKLYKILGHEKHSVKECMNTESSNKCEASYKMHLCYSRLKSIEAQRRLREILDYGDTGINDVDENETEGNGDGGNDCDDAGVAEKALENKPKENEIERT